MKEVFEGARLRPKCNAVGFLGNAPMSLCTGVRRRREGFFLKPPAILWGLNLRCAFGLPFAVLSLYPSRKANVGNV